MLAANKTIVAATRTDQTGKVFKVVGQDVRQCLICEQFFMQWAASEHARVVCASGTQLPSNNVKEQLKGRLSSNRTVRANDRTGTQ